MNVLGQYLDDRDDRRSEQNAADELWLRERAGIDPAARLQSWDRWLKNRLAGLLQWPSDPFAKARLQAQCAAELTVLARDLRGRGWLLDGKALAEHVDALLKPIGAAQAAGKVGDFWPYFRASVKRYVGLNAEEIQQHARRTGSEESAQSLGAILGSLKLTGESMTELLAKRGAELAQAKAETLRERQARLREKERARKADAEQPKLF